MTKLEDPEVTEVSPSPTAPPSLIRRAPARIDVADLRGNPPGWGRAGFHLRSGRRYRVDVWFQGPEDCGAITRCKVEAGRSLRTFCAPPKAVPIAARYFEIIEPRNRSPLPTKTEFSIVHVDDEGPHSFPVSVVVWPTWATLFYWVMGLMLALIGARFKALWEGKDGSALGALNQMVTNHLLLTELGGLFLLGMAGLLLVGRLWAAYGFRRD